MATPEAYGAIGNGVADDTAAFAAVFAANRLVELTAGATYLVDNVVLPDTPGLRVVGAATIRKRSGGDTHYLAASANYLSNLNYAQQPVRIEGVIFDAAGLAENALILQSWNSDVIEVEATGATKDGILVTANTRNGAALTTSLVNNRFKVRCHGNGNYGFHVKDTSRNKATDGMVSIGSMFYDNGSYASYIEAGAGWEISSARTYNNGGGFLFNGVGQGTHVHDCYIDDGDGALTTALPTGETYSAAVMANAHLGDGLLPVRSNLVTGPVTTVGNGDTAPYGILSQNNRYRGDAHLFHQYWGADHIMFSEGDVFETATPFRWHNNSSPGFFNVRNSHKLSNGKWVNGKFKGGANIATYETT